MASKRFKPLNIQCVEYHHHFVIVRELDIVKSRSHSGHLHQFAFKYLRKQEGQGLKSDEVALILEVNSILSCVFIDHTNARAWKDIMELVIEECPPHLSYFFKFVAKLL
jgi:hypothetical protein